MKKILLVLLGIYSTITCFAQVATIKETKTVLAAPAAPVIKGFACGNNPTKIWDKRFGGESTEELSIMLPTDDGGYLLGGGSWSSTSGDKTENTRGWRDYWVVKINAEGTKIWDKSFGGSDREFLTSIIASHDGGYLLGGFSYSDISGDRTESARGSEDAWVVKIDGNGNKVWDKRFGGSSYDPLFAMAATTDGGYILGTSSASGLSGDVSTPSKGWTDFWLIKINENGNKLWDKRYGGNSDDWLKTITPTNDGGFLLGGHSMSDISEDKTENSKGYTDYWVVKIDAEGNKLWDKTLGGANDERIECTIASNDGGYLLAGNSRSFITGDKTEDADGFKDTWLVKIDSNGNKVWDRSFENTANDDADEVRVVADMTTGYLVGRSYTPEVKPYYEYWVTKLDNNGIKLWEKTYGSDNDDRFAAILMTANGDFLLGGYSSSSPSGDKTEDSRGTYDYWIMKMNICQPITTFCEGQTFTLTASDCAGTIKWSTGAIANSIQINAEGTYTATCTVNNEISLASNSIIITPNTVNVNGIATNGISKAVNTITSTQTIPPGINATYQAGKSISLQGAFQAQTGSVFKAEIKGCE